MSWSFLRRLGVSRETVKYRADASVGQLQEGGETSIRGDFDLSVEDEDFADIWERCRPYTMTSFARGLALFRAVRYIAQNKIPGDFVECGVWRGGSTMIAMSSLKHFGLTDRNVCLFDTFEGMTAPQSVDIDISGVKASDLMAANPNDPAGIICRASLEEVRENIARIDYPSNLVEFIKGDVRETLKSFQKRPIAILRLDTDFYDSTRGELEELYPTLNEKGVLIIDDYGHWRGSRKAVDEYFDRLRSAGETSPMLSIIDYTGRMGIK